MMPLESVTRGSTLTSCTLKPGARSMHVTYRNTSENYSIVCGVMAHLT